MPDLTVHLLLDPGEGHLRLLCKEGAVFVSTFPCRDLPPFLGGGGLLFSSSLRPGSGNWNLPEVAGPIPVPIPGLISSAKPERSQFPCHVTASPNANLQDTSGGGSHQENRIGQNVASMIDAIEAAEDEVKLEGRG